MYQVLRLLACINTSSVIKATWNCPFAQTVLFSSWRLISHICLPPVRLQCRALPVSIKKRIRDRILRTPSGSRLLKNVRWIEKSMSISKCTLTSQGKIFMWKVRTLSQRRVLEDIQRRTTRKKLLFVLSLTFPSYLVQTKYTNPITALLL